MYEYKATVKKVVDGDTIDVVIDLGFKIQYTERIRLARMSTEEGKAVKKFVSSQLEGKGVVIKTEKNTFDKYGRWIAEVFYDDQKSINQLLLDNGMAVKYA